MKLLNGIGLGTFPLANPFTPVDEQTATRIVKTYLELGGQYIDTAPTYAFGKVETLLGKILKDFPRGRYFVNTSCGYVLGENGQFKVSGRYKDVIEDCEASLYRLGLDALDLYISHIPDPNTPFEETVRAMEDLRKQGKIKNIGVSNVTLEQLKEYNKTGSIQYVQNRFSLLNQSFAPDFIAYCQAHRIGIVAYQVIERGLLTNKVVDGIVLREGDLRHKKPEFAREIRQVIGQWVGEHLKPIAEDLETSVSALAIWWALQQPAIALCQCGATEEAHVVSNLQAITMAPPSDTLDRINASYQILADEVHKEYSQSIREYMGLAQYSIYSGSASGKST